METVGLVLQSSKMYILSALFFVANTLRVPLAAAAVQPLRTPGVHCFFHLIPAAIAIWATRDLGSISLKTLRGSAVPVSLSGIQVGCLFAALVADSIWLVLPWLVLMRQIVGFQRRYLSSNGTLSLPVVSVLACGVCTVALGAAAFVVPGMLGFLCLMVWTTAECGRVAWELASLQDQSHPLDLGAWAGSRGEAVGALMQDQIARQSKLPQAALDFYQSAVPAVPLLLLGLLCLEGKELVQHELSVPAVELLCW
ncbi:hypothetical protein WJX73_005240 [Symbiochloris irregularis]|uniref:Uncharacterized protein n=1 Tax=Symbiochloris irregularis TaxID=706552 RepID=A0AAW1PEF0_9CHLO